MSVIRDAIDMPMYSRFGKSQASLSELAVVERGRVKREPPPSTKLKSVIPTQSELDQALDRIAKELAAENKDTKIKKTKALHSAAFLAVSREQRNLTLRKSNAEGPPPTRYVPDLKWVKPKPVRTIKLRPDTTSPRAKKVLLSSCVSDATFTCKYAQKAADGSPILRSSAKGLKAVPEKEYDRALTAREVRTKDSYYPETFARPQGFRLEKMLSRKENAPHATSDERFKLINYFPQTYSGSRCCPCRRIKTPNFTRTLSRKDLFTCENLDSVYEYDIEKVRNRADHGVPDFAKMSPRGDRPADQIPESPDFQKILRGISKVLPRTHVPTLNMQSLTNRPDTAARVWDSVPRTPSKSSRFWSVPGTARSPRRG